MKRLSRNFYTRDILDAAPELLGKKLILAEENQIQTHYITEIEIYRGSNDKACHAHKGRTRRTEVMFGEGGYVYVYLIYGMYWMLNIVTGPADEPQAALIRGLHSVNGPGRIGKSLGLDKSFYGEDLTISKRIWIEDNTALTDYDTNPRIGIDYAGKPWTGKPWRYTVNKKDFVNFVND